MYKRILGRMRETKITEIELSWLYSTLIARQPIDPSYLMINRWCCEVLGGYPKNLDYSPNTREREQNTFKH
jgi:hypothetical protein